VPQLLGDLAQVDGSGDASRQMMTTICKIAMKSMHNLVDARDLDVHPRYGARYLPGISDCRGGGI
jgi:hypothetical protein